MINKDRLVSVCLLLIGAFGLIFSVVSNNKSKVSSEYKQVDQVNKEQFSMYVEDASGNYKEYDGHAFPNGYLLNIEESQCLDLNNNLVEDALSDITEGVTITSNKTVFCYLYFDLQHDVMIKVSTDGANE